MAFLTVTTQTGASIRLDSSSELARGGEGKILLVPGKKDQVAKIYLPGINGIQHKKFQILNKLNDKLFIKPNDLLFDSSSKIVGFTMDYLGQDYFPLSTVFNKTFCIQNSIDKKIKIKIIETLIEAIKVAHDSSVIIGDLNGYNIMVNKKGDTKFIDVDAYEAPGFPHCGRLLEDIRDYLYQGKVNTNSDFFALSILTFNLMAFIHPFKGIHAKYQKTADRMIHKLPVFINDSNLKLPKCYEPINNTNTLKQFEKMYLNGERFLFSLHSIDNTILIAPLPKPSMVDKFEKNDLIITRIMTNAKIRKVFFLNTKGIIITDAEFCIYDAANKGYLTLKETFFTKDWDDVYIGEKNILAIKNNEIFIYRENKKFERITNIQFPDNPIIKQFENILLVVGEDDMYEIHIDESIGNNVKAVTTKVFGKGFTFHGGLIYNSGGKQNIFFNTGDSISIAQVPIKINGIFQNRNSGIIRYIDKQQIKYKYFKVKGTNFQIGNEFVDDFNNFAYKSGANGEGFIFQPCDNSIKILRSQDFQEISQLTCDLVSTDSVLENSNAGIIIFEDVNVWLINKK